MNKTKPEPSRGSTKIRLKKGTDTKTYPQPAVIPEKQTRQSTFAIQHGYFESRMFHV